jgi:DNA-binding NtrC family response regulator
MSARLAIVEGDSAQAEVLAQPLRDEGYELITYADGATALDAFERGLAAVDLVLVNLATPRVSGLDLCAALRASRPTLPVVLVGAQSDPESAISAMRAGACDFLLTPVEGSDLLPCVRRAISRWSAKAAAVAVDAQSTELVGDSLAMQRVRDLLQRVSASGATVLIHGEPGTGKELVARALHALSPRHAGPFVAVDCTALLDHQRFGFVEASGGTLFLDEVGALSHDQQARVLRAVQDRRVRLPGSATEVEFNAKIICTTHQDLTHEVAAGRFRQDLFYRLNVVRVELPPLRERGRDIIALASLFLARASARDGATVRTMPADVAECLLTHAWPGNVRELENCIEQLAALARGSELSLDDMPQSVRPQAQLAPHQADAIITLDECEKRHVLQVLDLLQDNRSRAAELLGIDRRTLYRRLEGWGLPTWRTPSARSLSTG